jgi:beta-lactamase regulating signal transducer with metallopeptidase domain/predicted  nucleic acid-binding Zn-ribbon protein
MTGSAGVLFLLKASVLLAVALVVARALRRAPAARRHGVWSAAFVALVALPFLALTMPALHVPVPGWAEPQVAFPMSRSDDVGAGAAVLRGQPDVVKTTEATSQPQGMALAAASVPLPSPRTIVWSIWIAGAAATLLALLVALVRVGRLTAGGKSLDDPDWREARSRISARLGFGRNVRVLASGAIGTPMAGGLIRPTVFVPAGAELWDAERRDIVLSHEIAHLASADPLRILVSRLACTLYWFHPLVWLAARQSATDCEQACDDAVLALGVRPSTYARVLLDFADGAPLPSVALPMVRRARLETRLMAILDTSPRRATPRRALLPALAAAVLTLAVAAVQPAASSPAVSPAAVPAPATTKPATASREIVAPGPLVTTREAEPRVPVTQSPPEAPRALECWSERGDSRSFSGSMSMSGTTIYEQVGRRGRERVIMKSFGDVRVCMMTEGFTGDGVQRPSDWIGRAERVLLETQRPGDVRRMEIADGRMSWTINGSAQPIDAAVGTWRDHLLAVLDATWEVSQLRGQVSTLRGEISTIRGEKSTLQGEISTLRGQVSTMRGDISTLRGEESTLRGEISTIRGHVSTLQGQISTERGAISTLQAYPWDRTERDGISARIRRHEEAIRRVEDEIRRYDADARVRAVERRIDALDTDGRVAAIEREIRDFDVEAKIAVINRQIANLEVESRVTSIEGEIASLDADDRARELEARRDAALARLRVTLGGR